MAQNPPGPGPHRHRGALGGVRAGGAAGADHRGRGARAFLQTGGGAALPRARRGGGARPNGGGRGGARFGHAQPGKFLQRAKGKIPPPGNAHARRRQKNAGRPGGGHAPGGAAREEERHFFAGVEGGDPAAPGTQGTDHPFLEPARLLHFAAMRTVRLRGPMPGLQRLADVSPAGAEVEMPHLRP